VRSVLTRGDLFRRCGINYWDTTTDGGTAPALPGEEALCQMAQTSTALKSPERVYVDADHPNGNFDIFHYGGLIDRAFLAEFGGLECELGSGSDGDFGFSFCYGIDPGAEPAIWLLNSGSEYNTLANVYNPSGQAKN
jgi:hypothetical protein